MRRVLTGLVLWLSGVALAQEETPLYSIEPVDAPVRESVPIGSSGAGNELWEHYWDQTMVRNVTRPAVYPVLPEADKRNGKAVIVVPGGGYQFVSMDSEGFQIADALADAGYAAFVVKYRVTQTPPDPQAYMAHLGVLFGDLENADVPDYVPAIDDLAAAVRIVHENAPSWHVDPGRIGVIGFSSGGQSATRLLENYEEAALIQHIALIYPPMTQAATGGPRPPLFFAVAVDDPLFRAGGLTMIDGWLAESRDVEFHLYSGGSHGFGMRPMGTTSDRWVLQYLAWLEQR